MNTPPVLHAVLSETGQLPLSLSAAARPVDATPPQGGDSIGTPNSAVDSSIHLSSADTSPLSFSVATAAAVAGPPAFPPLVVSSPTTKDDSPTTSPSVGEPLSSGVGYGCAADVGGTGEARPLEKSHGWGGTPPPPSPEGGMAQAKSRCAADPPRLPTTPSEVSVEMVSGVGHTTPTTTRLLAATAPFWFNGQLMRVETVQRRSTGDGSDDEECEEIRVVATVADESVWVGLDRFRVPCRFARASDRGPAGECCPAVLLQRPCTSHSCLAHHHKAEKSGLLAAADDEWVSAAENTVAAHVHADAQRQLFRWSDAVNAAEEEREDSNEERRRVACTQLRCGAGCGEAREALLLQWWTFHH
jgi:hypothetical protein